MSKFDKVARPTVALDEDKVAANRRVWDAVAATDPDFTKLVTYGRKFTAIDGYYQVLRATELWGPFGHGWGYDLEYEMFAHGGEIGSTAMVKLTLWYMANGNRHTCGPVIATNQLVSWKDGKPHVDDEAFKKATTDALTKTLSYLGFSADVFLGAFDDNRYVDKRKQEVAKTDAAKGAALPEKLAAIVASLKTINTLPTLEAAHYMVWGNPKATPPVPRHPDVAKCSQAQVSYIALQIAKRKGELSPEEPDSAEAAA